jgi:NADH:ubiquinone reductase (H+-translocating)
MDIPAVPHIVIVGGGFGGLWTARGLANANVRVSLIDRCNHHLFQPLLYQVATAGLSAVDIAAPLRHILRDQANVSVLMAEATKVDRVGNTVELADGTQLAFDYLLLASGSTHAYFGHDDWAPFAPGLKTLDDALAIRRRVFGAFEEAELHADDDSIRNACLTFVVIGAGPTGVELAGTLIEIARHTLRREFRRIDTTKARVLLVEAGPRVLATFPEHLSAKAQAQLERLGVEVLTGHAVTQVDASGVTVASGHIAARSVLWAAGVAASNLGATLDTPLDRAGRVQVNADLSVPGAPHIFVAGDLAALVLDGKPVPGVAPAAKQMGAYVAGAIRDRIAGTVTAPFHYRDDGALATIGRGAAVVDLGRIRLSGMLAWLFWLAIHIFFLIGFRNRLRVMIDWSWGYWKYSRGARIMLGGAGDGADRTPNT